MKNKIYAVLEVLKWLLIGAVIIGPIFYAGMLFESLNFMQ
jgi:hypothetical protein